MEQLKKASAGTNPFYKNSGLRFACRRCSSCCRHTPGYVFLSVKDIEDLTEILGLSIEQLVGLCLRIVGIGGFYRVSLREKANFDCVFWEDGGCTVYPKRPFQCRSFPFWSSLLESEETWRSHRRMCPGIGEGPVHDFLSIESWRQVRLEERLIELTPANGTVELDEIVRSISQRMERA